MIELDHVSKRYDGLIAVDNVSLTIDDGELFVLIGPSGSGKSTILRMINRLMPHSSGTIRIGGSDITQLDIASLRRRMGYVIQSIGLFPHWTIERNVGAVPEMLGWDRARIAARVTELLTLLRLDPATVRRKYPHQLSGGQQQRVGVARALAADPEVLLMDEPFGALDPVARDALQIEIAQIQRASRKTIVFVTHDMEEALRLGSRIAILERGRLVQCASPLELLRAPANDFVRGFVGQDERGIRLLSVVPVTERLRPGDDASGEPIAATASLRQALSRMIERGADRLSVADDSGARVGTIHLADLVRQA
ncbi:MAG: transporter [Rhodospirillales bacterium]|jgi:osmoprotectant transport system ATP-binding protein|nr:transporter [Rhodospirillales bacterium]